MNEKNCETGQKLQLNRTCLTIPELARARGLKESWLYERSRRDVLPGQVRYGRLIRVDLEEFDAGVRAGALS
jgi:predicted DNA-binding transcriptional regulator AlpA